MKCTNDVFKVIVMGDGGVGKTTFLTRFTEKKFVEEMDITVGIDIKIYEAAVGDKNIIIQFWDFGGQQRFRFILDAFTRGAHGALLMYDLSRPDTAQNLESWIRIARTENPEIPIILVGTKYDRIDDNSADFNTEFLESFAREMGLDGYCIISSKTGEGINDTVKLLLQKILIRNVSANRAAVKTVA